MKFLKIILPISLLTLVPTTTECMLASARRFAVAYAPTFARTAATRAVVPVSRELMQPVRPTIIDTTATDVTQLRTPSADGIVATLSREVERTEQAQSAMRQKVAQRFGYENEKDFTTLIDNHVSGKFISDAATISVPSVFSGLMTVPTSMVTALCFAGHSFQYATMFGFFTALCGSTAVAGGKDIVNLVTRNFWGKKLAKATSAHKQAQKALDAELLKRIQ